MTFDYIIIGSGSAGSVIANQLTQNTDISVLLLEAGEYDYRKEIHIPFLYQSLLDSELDWRYQTEKEKYLLNRKIPIARGKVLGGCSSINAMVYVRGNRNDYDEWASMGNPGWSYQDLLPYFDQIENALNQGLYPKEIDNPHILSKQFIAAALNLGHPLSLHYNTDKQTGVVRYETNIKNGNRHSAATAFLHPISHRKNLHIETKAYVTQILFEKDKAIGISYIKNKKQYIANAANEIILSAGTFNSPKLLLLSGRASKNITTLEYPGTDRFTWRRS